MKLMSVLAVAVALAMSALPACEQDPTAELKKTAKKYLEAMENHDLETLTEMTDPGVLVIRGRSKVRGRKAFLEPVEFEAGVNASFEYSNIEIRGDTVDVDMIERNDLASALGLSEFHHFPRFVFSEGLLIRRESRKPTPELKAYAQKMEILRAWLKRERPDILVQIEDESGRYKTTRKAGELLVEAAQEWREAGASQ